MTQLPQSPPLRRLHRYSAIAAACFILIHIGNHLVGLAGVERHLSTMDWLRTIYRHPLVEPVLLAVFAFQAVTGLMLVIRGWRQREGAIAWAQAVSGAYLVAFLLVHVSSVLLARAVGNLDTNFYFAAAGLHVHPFQWFFGPYYLFAVAAFFIHIGCAAYWILENRSTAMRKIVLAGFALFGTAAGLAIVLALDGKLYELDIPAPYKATYQQRSGRPPLTAPRAAPIPY